MYVETFQGIFPAKITDKLQDSTGEWIYTWTEQVTDPVSGQYVDALSPRTGQPGNAPAYELNNNEVPLHIIRWLRFKSLVNGDTAYEFFFDMGTEASGTCMEVVVPPIVCSGNSVVYSTEFIKVETCSGS